MIFTFKHKKTRAVNKKAVIVPSKYFGEWVTLPQNLSDSHMNSGTPHNDIVSLKGKSFRK